MVRDERLRGRLDVRLLGEEIELREGLETIGESAFQNCGLKGVTVPGNFATVVSCDSHTGRLEARIVDFGHQPVEEREDLVEGCQAVTVRSSPPLAQSPPAQTPFFMVLPVSGSALI